MTAPERPAQPGGRRSTVLRRAALAAAGGVMLYAAHPPLELGGLGPFALVPLLLLARDLGGGPRPIRAGLWWGFAAGVVFFLPLLEWLRNVQLEAWPLLAATQAIFVAVFVAGVAAVGERRLRPVAAVVWWVALEAGRSELPFGGFGWGLLGYTQHQGGLFLPIARSLGVLGVGAALAAVAVCVEEAGVRLARRLPDPAGGSPGRRPPPELVLGAARAPLIALMVVLVGSVLLGVEPPAPTGRSIDVAAIQGFDVEGSTGRAMPRSLLVADKMVEVTQAATVAEGPPDLTIWPENALDGDVTASPELRRRLEAGLGLLEGGPLLTGQILDGPGPGRFRNTVALYEGDTRVRDLYVKRQYVPFGEYVPFRDLLGWYRPLGRIPQDGWPGEEPGVFETAGTRVGAVICFEVIFPNLVHDQVREGAELLVVATNNSSFGRGAASRQHIAFSQLRAVETGRWVVHAALSGASALVDPDGRVTQTTGLFEQAVVRADVPLVEQETLATRLGRAPHRAVQALAIVGMLWLGWQRRWQARRGAGTLPGSQQEPSRGTPSRSTTDAPVI